MQPRPWRLDGAALGDPARAIGVRGDRQHRSARQRTPIPATFALGARARVLAK
jgi:hypothetical protein